MTMRPEFRRQWRAENVRRKSEGLPEITWQEWTAECEVDNDKD